MQVKCKVFSRFASSVDFSSGEPLGGVEAPTVGADLCVRPSSPERSLFCGRTRRSAPTQATLARQFHSSNAVTPICRNARLKCPPLQIFTRLGIPTRESYDVESERWISSKSWRNHIGFCCIWTNLDYLHFTPWLVAYTGCNFALQITYNQTITKWRKLHY